MSLYLLWAFLKRFLNGRASFCPTVAGSSSSSIWEMSSSPESTRRFFFSSKKSSETVGAWNSPLSSSSSDSSLWFSSFSSSRTISTVLDGFSNVRPGAAVSPDSFFVSDLNFSATLFMNLVRALSFSSASVDGFSVDCRSKIGALVTLVLLFVAIRFFSLPATMIVIRYSTAINRIATTESRVIFTKAIAWDSPVRDERISFSTKTRVINGNGETIRHMALCTDHLESKHNAPATIKKSGISRLQNP